MSCFYKNPARSAPYPESMTNAFHVFKRPLLVFATALPPVVSVKTVNAVSDQYRQPSEPLSNEAAAFFRIGLRQSIGRRG